MTRTFAELQSLCTRYSIEIPTQRRPAKEPLVLALRDYFWSSESPGRPLPEQILPMLLGDWNDLDGSDALAIEADDSGWCVQEKHDGIRVLLHITDDGVRLTGRNVSEVTFRLSELTANVPHLINGFEHLDGTILDGELVCPQASIDTGDTITTHQLQAAVAILATSPETATAIQEQQDAHLRFFAFDVLRFRGEDITEQPLSERLKMLDTAYLMAENAYLRLAETQTEAKSLFHELTLSEGKEGTVWKKLDEPYEPGKRVRHWLKRKNGIEVIAAVTGFKPGTKGKGNEHLVGAIEFSTAGEDGGVTSIAWVSSWTDEERREMTRFEDGIISLNPNYLGKKAVIGGHDIAGKSGRVRHARLVQWIENPLVEAADVTKPAIEDELARLAA